MTLFHYLKTRNWPAVLGYGFFIGMLATGYYYNVTLVQLGLLDLGERLVGLDQGSVAGYMALLALLTSLVSLGVGWTMQRRGWSADFVLKLRLALVVVVAQTVLTALAPGVRTPAQFLAWIVGASCALGLGVPVTFGLTVDLIPRPDRGYAAALITAAAYFAAPLFAYPWRIESLSRQMLWVMLPGAGALAVLAFAPLPFVRQLARQHTQPQFYYGRFVRATTEGGSQVNRQALGMIGLMFGVFFVDSLGFVRLTHTPALMAHAWQSPELGPRLTIALVHVAAALIAGVLYSTFSVRSLFLWVFGLFALVHLAYTFPFRPALGESGVLAQPMLYAVAVSLYTVLNFAVWADLSTPRTISRYAALGVSASAWSATFISTALAIQWENAGLPLATHLRVVDALAALFFLGLLLLVYFEGGGRGQERPPIEIGAGEPTAGRPPAGTKPQKR